ncbi:Phage terminase large subunit [Caballeronia temeraria]|uniref:Phage terminase large subunit n=1 Tax=Caballeronia temeraria TaxID=1777137 RepID=A0A157ZM29_9BURK|nr:PBSX family phage terminase large subunit [Caballeronia temeraria]SAK46565.1 Phage terminase large subunit [Caballeronia temeraria]
MNKALLKRLEVIEQTHKDLDAVDKPRLFRIGVFEASRKGKLKYVIDAFGNKLEGMDYDAGITITENFMPLFDKKYRFVSMRGGRAGMKTDTTGLVLLLMSYYTPLRILCFREVQNSIKQSVYATLKKMIEKLGLESFFEDSTENEIRGKNGSIFMFKGLRDQTVENVKSFSDVDVCWGEEARALTERSLQVLIPTVVRNEGARFFFTWNPQQDSDAVYQRYVLNKSDRVCDIWVNFQHNPWFIDAIDEERQEDKNRLPVEQYEWIWEGKVLPALVGSVYFNEVSLAVEQNRITRVSVDPLKAVHQVWDLGMADNTAIILVQTHLSEVRIVGYIENRGKNIAWYNEQIREWGRQNHVTSWGTAYLPHDGAHRDMSGNTPEHYMKAFGWKTAIMPPSNPDVGIRAARMMFPNVWIDRDCGKLIECLKRYRYKENPDGSLSTVVHDIFSHGADAFRYLALEREKLTDTQKQKYTGQPLRRNHTVFR